MVNFDDQNVCVLGAGAKKSNEINLIQFNINRV